MKRIVLLIGCLLVFALSLLAQSRKFSQVVIQGTSFSVELHEKNNTLTLLDVSYEVDDREYPLKPGYRKFAKKLTDGRLAIPSVFDVYGKQYTLVKIGRCAFAGYREIKEVEIPTTVREIGEYAFFRTSLTGLYIPENVRRIGDRAFGWCPKLVSVIFARDGVQEGERVFADSKKMARLGNSNVSGWDEGSDYAEDTFEESEEQSGAKPKRVVQEEVVVVDSELDNNIPMAAKENENTFAVIIGNENYASLPAATFARNDSEVFAEYCRCTLGLPAENVRIYPDATYGNITSAITKMKDIADAYNGDLNIIFYYVGHGVPDDKSHEGYLLPVDSDGRNMATCYKIDKLIGDLNAMNAKSTVVFLDACFSGALRDEGMIAEDTRGVAIRQKPTAPRGNMVVFSAASGTERAHPYKKKGHGVFTYFLLKKLRDTKGDVTLGELSEYVKSNVVKVSAVNFDQRQTPVVTASSSFATKWKKLKLIP